MLKGNVVVIRSPWCERFSTFCKPLNKLPCLIWTLQETSIGWIIICLNTNSIMSTRGKQHFYGIEFWLQNRLKLVDIMAERARECRQAFPRPLLKVCSYDVTCHICSMRQ